MYRSNVFRLQRTATFLLKQSTFVGLFGLLLLAYYYLPAAELVVRTRDLWDEGDAASDVLPQSYSCVELSKTKLPYEICLHNGSKDSNSEILGGTGLWEPHLQQRIVQTLQDVPSAQFIDVGAFVGVHSFLAAKLGRQVVAFEPFSDTRALFREGMKRNNFTSKQIKLLPHCLYSHRSFVAFNRSELSLSSGHLVVDAAAIEDHSDGASLHLQAQEQKLDKNTGDKSRYACITLNDIVERLPFVVAVLKIDIEGSESQVFTETSADRFFDAVQIPLVLMEWYHQRDEKLVEPMLDFFYSRGFVPTNFNIPPRRLNRNEWRKWPFDVCWVKLKPWERVEDWLEALL